MLADAFEREIRKYIRARPFEPFLIVLEDGRTIVADKPSAAIDAGGAGFVDATGELQLLECEQVREFRPAREELAR
jgi:hypothetical protein